MIAFCPFCLLAFFYTFGLNSKNPTFGSIGRLLLSNSMCPLSQLGRVHLLKSKRLTKQKLAVNRKKYQKPSFLQNLKKMTPRICLFRASRIDSPLKSALGIPEGFKVSINRFKSTVLKRQQSGKISSKVVIGVMMRFHRLEKGQLVGKSLFRFLCNSETKNPVRDSTKITDRKCGVHAVCAVFRRTVYLPYHQPQSGLHKIPLCNPIQG